MAGKETAEGGPAQKDGLTVDQLRERWQRRGAADLRRPRIRPGRGAPDHADADEVIPKVCTERLGKRWARPRIHWSRRPLRPALPAGKALKEISAHLLQRTVW